jgi:D-3-phosphoglycerate dehydrogenase / 2-oxoglutarate reductase
MNTSYPKDKIKVVLLESVHPVGAAALKAEGFTIKTSAKALEGPDLLAAAKDAHILGIRSKTQITSQVLDAAPHLLAVGCFCIGTNQVDLAHACSRGVPVFNSPFTNTRSVAELTVAEVIALSRRTFEKSTQLHAGTWDKSAAGSREVRGKTLGIIGYGHIGSQVSVLAEALGMKVLYYDIVPKQPLGNAKAARSLDEVLAAADVITLHVPETAATKGMFAAPQIKKLKPGATLINNARGSIIHIPALAAALKEGRLSGAALDVFPDEPAGRGDTFKSEVCGLPNVILTPHIGGSTEEAQEAIGEDVAAKLAKFINNGSTTGAVNVPEVELPEQSERAGGGMPLALQRQDLAASEAGPSRHHRILHFHKNVPGVLSKMHSAIADLGVNIVAEHLQTRAEVGYVVLDIEPAEGKAILERLRKMPETIRVRMLW